MRYMQDLPQATVAPELLRWLAAAPSADARAKWLLFDGAILGEKVTGHLRHTLPAKTIHNIFANTELAAYGWAAPHLVSVPQGPRGANFLHTMLGLAAGKPAVAVLDVRDDLEELCGRLSWLAQAKTVEGMRLYCRFADTRITPALITVLCSHQRSVLQQSIEEWKIVDRNGDLRSILTRSTDSPVVSGHCNIHHDTLGEFVLSDEQFLAMMRSAEADEIFQMLCEGAPDLVPDFQLRDFHVRLLSLAVAARRRGLESTSEIFQFSVIALSTCDSFFSHPALNGFWLQVGQQKGSFASLVQNWPDETWSLLASRRRVELPDGSAQRNDRP